MIRNAASKVMWGQGARTLAFFLLALVVAASIGLLISTNPAHADTTIRVNSMEDAGDNNPGNGTCSTAPFQHGTEPNCTLRAAIQEANADGVSDTIIFDSFLSGTILLTLGQLEIANDTPANDLIIEGPEARDITVNGGNGLSRVFYIKSGSVVEIGQLTITGGSAPSDAYGVARGGGIYNDGGTLTVRRSTISVSHASAGTDGSSFGGGIYNAGGRLALENATVSGNTAYAGGGIYNANTTLRHATLRLTSSTVSENRAGNGGGVLNGGGTLTLENATVSENTASRSSSFGGYGGGIYTAGGTLTLENATVSGNSAKTADNTTIGGWAGGIYSIDGSTVRLENATVSENTARNGAGGIANTAALRLTNSTVSENTATNTNSSGGGIINQEGTLTLANTIVARNAANTAPDIRGIEGTLTSQGYNLIGDTTGSSSSEWGASDLLNLNPLLGPLQDNGGPTNTHALLPGSPAVDAGANTACPPTDQRGVAREDGDENGSVICDIGAFERDDLTPPKVTTATPTGEKAPRMANVTATFSEAMSEDSVEAAGAFTLKKKGAKGTISATVTYDPATKKAALDPTGKLRSGATYMAKVTPAAEDSAGNALDQKPGVSGNQPKSWRFTVN